MAGKTWFRIRSGLLAYGFIAAAATAHVQLAQLRSFPFAMTLGFYVVCAVMLLAIPLMLVAVIGFQAVNPFSDKMWTRPTHQSNPFRFGNPLLFFHFAGYFFGAAGLGVLVSALWNGLPALLGGLEGMVGAFTTLVGVRWAMHVYRFKMAPVS